MLQSYTWQFDKKLLGGLRVDAMARKYFVLVGLFLGAFQVLAHNQSQKETKPDLVVYAARAELKPLKQEIDFAGRVRARREHSISSPVDGSIFAWRIKEGQRVQKDQVLAEIRPPSDGRELRMPFKILASASGTLIEKKAYAGAAVKSAQVVGTMALGHDYEVIFYAATQDVNLLDKVSVLDIYTLEQEKKHFKGKVIEISQRVDDKTAAVKVRLRIDRASLAGHQIFVGQLVKLKLTLRDMPAILIPAKFFSGDLKQIFVLKENKDLSKRYKVVKVQVETGLRIGNQIEVLKGVQPGDLYMTEYVQFPNKDDIVAVENLSEL